MQTENKWSRLMLLLYLSLVLLIQMCSPAYAAAVDTKQPTVPTKLTVINKTYTTITLSWTGSTDDTKVKGYEIYRDGKKIVSVTKTTYTNTRLVPGRKYTYSVRAYDAAGNTSADSLELIAATIADTQNPSTPLSLSAASPTFNTITLDWAPSTDNTSIKGYEIYNNDKKVATSSNTSYVVKRLKAGTSYSFYIKAVDIAGNYSNQSIKAHGATLSDNSAPSIPMALKAVSTTETEVNLSWSPSSDNVKVKSYDIFRDGKRITSTSKTAYCNKSLLPGSTYSYTIKAIDTSGNVSGSSSPLKASTVKDTKAPKAPAELKLKSVRGSSVSLTWTASTDNIKVKGYQIFCNGLMIETSSKNSRTVKSPFGMGVDIYWVTAYDQSGNLSESSNKLTVVMPIK